MTKENNENQVKKIVVVDGVGIVEKAKENLMKIGFGTAMLTTGLFSGAALGQVVGPWIKIPFLSKPVQSSASIDMADLREKVIDKLDASKNLAVGRDF